MFTRVCARVCGAFVATALSVGFAAGASAATINLTAFDRSDLAGARQARADFLDSHAVGDLRVETFEGKAAWNGATGTTNPGNTNAGDFTTLGGRGSGASHINGGTGLEVRGDNRMAWGRFNTDDGVIGGKWLDSNDTSGMRWDIGGLGAFDTLAFFLTDVADVGGKFSIKVGETLFSQVLGAGGRLRNGNIQFVTILLPEAVTDLTVELFNDRLNDGFGIDGATVGTIAPVPVPPAAALLASGVIALGAVRRRRRTARV